MSKIIYHILRLFRRFNNLPTNKKLYSKYVLLYLIHNNKRYSHWSRERDYVVIFNTESDMLAWDLECPNFAHKKDKTSFYQKNSVRFEHQKELRGKIV